MYIKHIVSLTSPSSSTDICDSLDSALTPGALYGRCLEWLLRPFCFALKEGLDPRRPDRGVNRGRTSSSPRLPVVACCDGR